MGKANPGLQPLGDKLLVELLEEPEQTVAGIIIPDAHRERPTRARVLAVGPGPRSESTGVHMPMAVVPGDVVVFSKYGGTEVSLDGSDYMILREADLFGIDLTTRED